MIIVSGCPRSGTSVMMDCFREVYGDENILGSKFPQERPLEQGEKEPDHLFKIREWMQNQNKRSDDYSDLNPNGFWECRYSVQGIRYNFIDKENLQKYEANNRTEEQPICKIVSQGLLASDTRYFDKIVYMNRHPRSVAKSQERLKRGVEVRDFNGEYKNMFEGITIHTPEMYINVTLSACKFFLENPSIPVHFVDFDDLQMNPIEEQKKIQKFIGYGDWSKSKDIVSPKLNRSTWQDIEHMLWEDAEWLWENFTKQNFQECLDYFQNPKLNINKQNFQWHCPRSNMAVNHFECLKCTTNTTIRDNFKRRAFMAGLKFEDKPCLFECGLNVDDENPISIEESIENNTWVD